MTSRIIIVAKGKRAGETGTVYAGRSGRDGIRRMAADGTGKALRAGRAGVRDYERGVEACMLLRDSRLVCSVRSPSGPSRIRAARVSQRCLKRTVALALMLESPTYTPARASRPRSCGEDGRSLCPIRNRSTPTAASRPSQIAHTISDCPRRASPAANMPGTVVM